MTQLSRGEYRPGAVAAAVQGIGEKRTARQILFVSFAQSHSTARRKVTQAAGAGADIAVYDAKVNKNKTSIRRRVISGDYLRLLRILLFSSREEIWWLWGADVCLVGALAGLLRPSKIIVWDISDIQHRFLDKSILSYLLRTIEAALIKRCNKLVLSSASFWDHYYSRRVPAERVSIIENLLEGSPRRINRPAPTDTVNIVYSGIIRSETLMRLILDCAAVCRGGATFHLWGFFHPDVRKTTRDEIEKSANVVYHGAYDEHDLAEIYDGMQITFGMVDITSNDNERWLLSNRLYQAGAFRCPIVATRGSKVADVAVERNLGWVLDNDCKEMAALFASVLNDPKSYLEMVRAMPDQKQFYFGDEYSRLLASL